MFLKTFLAFPILAMVGCFTHSAADFLPPDTLSVASGMAVLGSDRAEWEAAYQMDEKAYGIMRDPVTTLTASISFVRPGIVRLMCARTT